jgi:adenylate cyclase
MTQVDRIRRHLFYGREMSAAALEKGGTVDRLTANGVTILFGAPSERSLSDQALAAIRTAVAMREGLSNLVSQWRRRGILGKLAMRAGIQTGFCTVGVFGSELLRSYTAVGTPVTISASLRDDASPWMIVCGPSTWGLLEETPDIRSRSRGPRSLNGVGRPLVCYEILEIAGDRIEEAHPLPLLRDYSFLPR